MLAVLCCLLALGGLFVAHGTVGYDPGGNTYPGNEEVGTSYEKYVGDLARVRVDRFRSDTTVSWPPPVPVAAIL